MAWKSTRNPPIKSTALFLFALTLILPSQGACGIHRIHSRGASLLSPPKEANPHFDSRQSAGLFVGVRLFRIDDSLTEVRYAVDDAVDLAFFFSLEAGLVEASRIVILLSGQPEKKDSRRRLERLIDAGASLSEAGHSDIEKHLEHLSRTVGPDGLLLVAFATHGVNEKGDYLLGADSRLSALEKTAISLDFLIDTITEANTTRKIVLLDACRARLTTSRGPAIDPRSAMSEEFKRALALSEGQVILAAARPHGYAYDDHKRLNGVFTAEILEALHCRTEQNEQGLVRVMDLADAVNQRMIEWIRINKPNDPARESGIEVTLGGLAAKMALAQCEKPLIEPKPVPAQTVLGTRTPDPCSVVKLNSLDIDLGPAGSRTIRIDSPAAKIILTAQEIALQQNLNGRAILSGSKELFAEPCRCQWEMLDDSGWAELDGSGDGCSFSIIPPRPSHSTTLRLTLGKKETIVIFTVH